MTQGDFMEMVARKYGPQIADHPIALAAWTDMRFMHMAQGLNIQDCVGILTWDEVRTTGGHSNTAGEQTQSSK